MLNVKIKYKLIALLTLCLFVISTSGVVFFYHFCQHSNQLLYSVYVDDTNDMCMEYAKIQSNDECTNSCCAHHNQQKNSNSNDCSHDKSYIKTAKLNNKFTNSKQITFPKPATLQLIILNICCTYFTKNTYLVASFYKTSFRPPEQPINKLYGKKLLTSYHSFKIDC